MSVHHQYRRRFSLAVACTLVAASAGDVGAQATSPVVTTPVVAKAPSARAAGSTAAAWALPDPDRLIEGVFRRIVSQDKPNAIPVAAYSARMFGKTETLEAIRQFTGYPVELNKKSYSSLEGWTDTRRSEFRPCAGPGCAPPATNSLWLAVTRIERGELPHELHVWYTTAFESIGPLGPATQTYNFCERWLRVNGTWKYDGFVRVTTG